jgi:hypothetical protein
MVGDDRVRHCEECGKHVYNLTAMRPDETTLLLAGIRERGERRCVRIYQRPDGTLTSSACRAVPPEAPIRWQFTIRTIMAVIAGWAALLGLARLLKSEHKPASTPPPAGTQILTGDLY